MTGRKGAGSPYKPPRLSLRKYRFRWLLTIGPLDVRWWFRGR